MKGGRCEAGKKAKQIQREMVPGGPVLCGKTFLLVWFPVMSLESNMESPYAGTVHQRERERQAVHPLAPSSSGLSVVNTCSTGY